MGGFTWQLNRFQGNLRMTSPPHLYQCPSWESKRTAKQMGVWERTRNGKEIVKTQFTQKSPWLMAFSHFWDWDDWINWLIAWNSRNLDPLVELGWLLDWLVTIGHHRISLYWLIQNPGTLTENWSTPSNFWIQAHYSEIPIGWPKHGDCVESILVTWIEKFHLIYLWYHPWKLKTQIRSKTVIFKRKCNMDIPFPSFSKWHTVSVSSSLGWQ